MIINTTAISPAQAIETIIELWPLKRTIMLWGPPGSAKSEIVQQVGQRLGATVHDERLGTRIACDLTGLPYLDAASGVTTYLRPEFLPVAAEKSILFLDELTTAEEQTRTAAYGLILERRVGKYHLPDDCRVIAASNREEDGAVSANLGTALYDRMIHLVIAPTVDSWLKWACDNNIHPAVMGLIKTQGHLLQATPEQLIGENALLPSPRSWKAVSDVLHTTQQSNSTKISTTARIAIQGIIGTETAVTFFALAEQVVKMPSLDTLFAASDKQLPALLPQSASILYALGYALTANINATTVNAIFRIINAMTKLPSETCGADIATMTGALICNRAQTIAGLATTITGAKEFITYDAWASESLDVAA